MVDPSTLSFDETYAADRSREDRAYAERRRLIRLAKGAHPQVEKAGWPHPVTLLLRWLAPAKYRQWLWNRNP